MDEFVENFLGQDTPIEIVADTTGLTLSQIREQYETYILDYDPDTRKWTLRE